MAAIMAETISPEVAWRALVKSSAVVVDNFVHKHEALGAKRAIAGPRCWRWFRQPGKIAGATSTCNDMTSS
jgi:hypothetical protein